MSLIVPNDILFNHITGLLDQGKSVTFQVKGCSMLPFIVGERDSVNVHKGEFAPGDAVLAHLPGGNYVLHRVESIDGDSVTLKGDGNLSGREHCRAEDVKGKVVQVLKRGSRPVDVTGPSYRRKVKRWNSLPYIVRRVVLAIMRRIVK